MKEKKPEFGVSEVSKMQLVDKESGEVMFTVDIPTSKATELMDLFKSKSN